MVAAFAASASSGVNLDSWPYTHTACPGNSSNRADPVNFALYDHGTIGRITNQVSYHAHWSDTGGSTQSFGERSTGSCFHMDAQAASGNVWNSRYHIRFHHLTKQDPSYFDVTVGDAHHEDFVWTCPGHAVDQDGPQGSGFDQGRRNLRQNMEAGGHYWWSTWWGNTQQFTQCDGGVANSDGYTVFVQIHSWNH